MVDSVTMGRNGPRDWLIQRATALVMLAYTLFLTGFFFVNAEVQFADWQALFAHTGMRIFTLLTVVSLVAHAWVGMWTVATDYLNSGMLGSAATLVRYFFYLGCLVVLFVYLVWCVQILWSI